MSAEISHREVVAALAPEVLTALKASRDGPGLKRLAIQVPVLLASGSLVFWLTPSFLLLPALVVHGILVVFLFTLEHECIHGTAFRNPALNAICAAVGGFLLVLPPTYFRFFHFAHHRFTQDPAHDPELATPRPRDRREYLIYLSGIPYWRAAVTELWRNALGQSRRDYVPPGGQPRLVWEARAYAGAYAMLALVSIWQGWTWPLWLWVFPALLGQPFLRAYLLAEHGACPLVADMLTNTRTTFTNRIVNGLAWNMPHHTAHHALPVVPFHQLPELTRLLKPHLRTTAEGYVAAHRDIRSAWQGDK